MAKKYFRKTSSLCYSGGIKNLQYCFRMKTLNYFQIGVFFMSTGSRFCFVLVSPALYYDCQLKGNAFEIVHIYVKISLDWPSGLFDFKGPTL